MGETHHRKENPLIWCHDSKRKKPLKDKGNIIKAQRETGSGAFIVSTLSATVHAAVQATHRGSASIISYIFYLYSPAETDCLPLSLKRWLVCEFNHPFSFGQRQLRFDSCHFGIGSPCLEKRKIFLPSSIFEKPFQTGGVIAPRHYGLK